MHFSHLPAILPHLQSGRFPGLLRRRRRRAGVRSDRLGEAGRETPPDPEPVGTGPIRTHPGAGPARLPCG